MSVSSYEQTVSEPWSVNPFVYHYNISWLHKLKMYIFTLLLLPLKMILTGLMFLVTLAFAKLITMTYPYTKSPIPRRDFRRRVLLPLLTVVARTVYFCGGFYWIEVKGRQATREEAPIFVVGPHSSFLDSLVVVYVGMSAVVTTKNFHESWVGALIEVLQPILVDRADPTSRRKTVEQICHRSRSKNDWPQLIVFPEGTCTNRTSLISFKPGAFQPGVPVQPVLIRWPNTVDCGTWVWEGPGVLKLLWIAMTQLYIRFQIEFLPVYTPNTDEKSDPQLFANNVRQVMASALQIPTCDLVYDDFRRIRIAKRCHLPMPEATVFLNQLIHSLFIKPYQNGLHSNNQLSVEHQLSRLLSVARSHPFLSQLEFIEVLYPHSRLDYRNTIVLNHLAQYYHANEISSSVHFRLLMAHLCMLMFASRPRIALRYTFQVFVSHNQLSGRQLRSVTSSESVTSWFISTDDARWLLFHVFHLEDDVVMDAVLKHSTAIPTCGSTGSQRTSTCADWFYKAVSEQASHLLTGYQQYWTDSRRTLDKLEHFDALLDTLHGDALSSSQLSPHTSDESTRVLFNTNTNKASTPTRTTSPVLSSFDTGLSCSDAYRRTCAKLAVSKLNSA